MEYQLSSCPNRALVFGARRAKESKDQTHTGKRQAHGAFVKSLPVSDFIFSKLVADSSLLEVRLETLANGSSVSATWQFLHTTLHG